MLKAFADKFAEHDEAAVQRCAELESAICQPGDHVPMSGTKRRHSFVLACISRPYINGCDFTKNAHRIFSHIHLHTMAPIALGLPTDRHTHFNGTKKPEQDGFGTRAVHIGSEPDASTGAVIPAISLSTTYKQHGVGNHKVRVSVKASARDFLGNLLS